MSILDVKRIAISWYYSTQWDEILSEAFACRSSDIEVMDSNLFIAIMTKIIFNDFLGREPCSSCNVKDTDDQEVVSSTPWPY